MGLEGVELIMDVEDTFHIKITDEEATNCISVGQLHDLVLNKVDYVNYPETCLTQKTFYQLREFFVKELGISKRKVTVKTNMHDLIPMEDRKTIWKQLIKKTQLDLPDLVLPGAIVLLYFILCLIFTSFTYYKTWHNTFWVFCVLVGWILFFSTIIRRLSNPVATAFPYNCKTIGDLTRTAVGMNFYKLSKSIGKNEIWDIVTTLVSDQLGVEKSELKPETEFVKDLNIG